MDRSIGLSVETESHSPNRGSSAARALPLLLRPAKKASSPLTALGSGLAAKAPLFSDGCRVFGPDPPPPSRAKRQGARSIPTSPVAITYRCEFAN